MVEHVMEIQRADKVEENEKKIIEKGNDEGPITVEGTLKFEVKIVETIDFFLDFLEFAVQQVLYIREVYPLSRVPFRF